MRVKTSRGVTSSRRRGLLRAHYQRAPHYPYNAKRYNYLVYHNSTINILKTQSNTANPNAYQPRYSSKWSRMSIQTSSMSRTKHFHVYFIAPTLSISWRPSTQRDNRIHPRSVLTSSTCAITSPLGSTVGRTARTTSPASDRPSHTVVTRPREVRRKHNISKAVISISFISSIHGLSAVSYPRAVSPARGLQSLARSLLRRVYPTVNSPTFQEPTVCLSGRSRTVPTAP